MNDFDTSFLKGIFHRTEIPLSVILLNLAWIPAATWWRIFCTVLAALSIVVAVFEAFVDARYPVATTPQRKP